MGESPYIRYRPAIISLITESASLPGNRPPIAGEDSSVITGLKSVWVNALPMDRSRIGITNKLNRILVKKRSIIECMYLEIMLTDRN